MPLPTSTTCGAAGRGVPVRRPARSAAVAARTLPTASSRRTPRPAALSRRAPAPRAQRAARPEWRVGLARRVLLVRGRVRQVTGQVNGARRDHRAGESPAQRRPGGRRSTRRSASGLAVEATENLYVDRSRPSTCARRASSSRPIVSVAIRLPFPARRPMAAPARRAAGALPSPTPRSTRSTGLSRRPIGISSTSPALPADGWRSSSSPTSTPSAAPRATASDPPPVARRPLARRGRPHRHRCRRVERH